jgi:hypothetical protein
MLDDEVEGIRRHELKAGERTSQTRHCPIQKRDRFVERVQGGKCDHAGRRQRIELEYRRGDDAERAFRADEQVAQGVGGIVLSQASQAVPDPAIRGHHFQPEAQIARIAVAQHRGSARIRGQVSADGA